MVASKKISFLSPVYKNETSLRKLVSSCFEEGAKHFSELEYVLVNDGSPDGSQAILEELAAADRRVKVVRLARNFGQHSAIMAGLEYCRGDYVLLLDADLEENPSYLTPMVEEIGKGFEIVVGIRSYVRHTLFRRVSAKCYSIINSWLTDYPLMYNTTSMRLMTRRYVEYLLKFSEPPFVGGFTVWIGLPIGKIPFHWTDQKRKSSFTLGKLLSYGRIGIISFSSKLLRLASVVGILLSMPAFIYLGFLIVRFLLFGQSVPGFYTVAGLLTLISGLICIFLGILGEYVSEIHDLVKRRPRYLVFDTLNTD